MPEGSGTDVNLWTLIFFPDSESKKTGRATLEAWSADKDTWNDSMTETYQYEIRDGTIELYNGYGGRYQRQGGSWIRGGDMKLVDSRVSDMRLIIENGKEGIQLRGEFSKKERIFKQARYRDSRNRQRHYHMHN